MNNTMEYKGYVGSVEFSEEDGLFYGKVMGIRALLSYEGMTSRPARPKPSPFLIVVVCTVVIIITFTKRPIRAASMSASRRSCTSRPWSTPQHII